MDNKKVGLDQLGVIGNGACKIVKKLDMDAADMETDDNLRLSSSPSMVDNVGFGLSPITPESNKESSELMSCFVSLLTMVSSDTSENDGEVDGGSPSTPKDGVFDPFAPGPDSLMLAPRTVKYLLDSRSFVERKLDFNSVMTKNNSKHVSENALEDDDDVLLLEAVYNSLLECIISKHAEDVLGEISAIDSSSLDVLVTPSFAPRLTGIADTCPDAPLKRAMKKSRCIDVGLCRKLELEF
ncbi:uncharacterized protein LOC143625827 [Bidens hawaiensis]|uniref:uncharacterized protein LOC143625827 n=1 Tax=Bidens hawaiensis TaxID=980011 RepID=UPI00404A36B4